MRNFIFGIFVGALIVGAGFLTMAKRPGAVVAAAPPATSPFKVAATEAFDAIETAGRFSLSPAAEFEPNHAKALEAVNRAKRSAASQEQQKGALLLRDYLDHVQLCRFMFGIAKSVGDRKSWAKVDECIAQEKAKALAAKNAIGATSWADVSTSVKQ